MSDTSDSQLDALLAKLPREVAPPQDLWAAIEAGMPAHRSCPQLPWRLAAGLAAIAISAAISLHFGYHRAHSSSDRDLAFEAPRNASYLRTRAELERSYREQLDQLPAETRKQVEHDLEVIRGARDDLRRALGSDPESPLLQELMATTWQQEIDLYQDVAASSTVSHRSNL